MFLSTGPGFICLLAADKVYHVAIAAMQVSQDFACFFVPSKFVRMLQDTCSGDAESLWSRHWS